MPSPGPRPKPTPVPLEAESSFELVRRACGGDPDAEAAVCARYLPRLHRWARGRLPRGARPAMDTGDVVQEVLIRAFRSFPSFEPEHQGSFPAYLRTILANRLNDLARVDQRRPPPDPLETVADPVSPDASPFDLTVTRENHEQFDAGMKQLTPADQELIFLRVELGCDYEDVAEMVGRDSVGATRMACRRAMLRLAAAVPKAPPTTAEP
jgi:RNA polymerase sigma factor (sigma-70 family)